LEPLAVDRRLRLLKIFDRIVDEDEVGRPAGDRSGDPGAEHAAAVPFDLPASCGTRVGAETHSKVEGAFIAVVRLELAFDVGTPTSGDLVRVTDHDYPEIRINVSEQPRRVPE
jgi:hypothetical protein